MTFSQLIDRNLFTIGGTTVTVVTLATGLLIVGGGTILSRLLQAALRRTMTARGMELTGGVRVATRLLHYTIVAIALAIALQTAGVELTALFAASAVFAVGLGFAMQNIAENFVSGVILLLERTIRPGDVLEFDGRVVRVQRMGIRATIVRTRAEEDVIVPNAILVQQAVKNLTLGDSSFRVRVTIGVAYGSDVVLVRRVLQAVADTIAFRAEGTSSVVLLSGFGESSIDYTVAVTSLDPWAALVHESDLREAIWAAFQREKIEIAFPQLDVHFDPAVTPDPPRQAA